MTAWRPWGQIPAVEQFVIIAATVWAVLTVLGMIWLATRGRR